MAALFSKRLLAGNVTPSTPLTVTVPSTVLWIVRNIDILVSGTGQAAVALLVPNVGYIFRAAAVDGNNSTHFTTAQVLNAGEQLQAVCLTTNVAIMVSGYELTLP